MAFVGRPRLLALAVFWLEEAQPWHFDIIARFDSPTWDETWLQLVQHYFTLFKWSSLEQRNPAPISLVEIMLDLCLIFQVLVSVNLQVTKLSGPDVPVLAPKDPAKYYLPTRKMGMVLPPECLKQTSHTFLLTFDYLQKLLHVVPVERENLRSLSSGGYSNVLPSLRISPVPLSGQLARNFLSCILSPGICVPKYSYQIPLTQPRSLPAHFPTDF